MEGGGGGGDSQAATAVEVESPVRPDHDFNLDPPDVSVSSAVTRQKAAAAKQLIENHYKNYLQGLQTKSVAAKGCGSPSVERNRRLIGLWLRIGKLFDYETQTIDEF